MDFVFHRIELWDTLVTDDGTAPLILQTKDYKAWEFEDDGRISYKGSTKNVAPDLVINSSLDLLQKIITKYKRKIRGSILYSKDSDTGIYYGIVYFYDDIYKISEYDAELPLKKDSSESGSDATSSDD